MNQTAELIDPSNNHLFARLIFSWISPPIQIPAHPYKLLWQQDAGGQRGGGNGVEQGGCNYIFQQQHRLNTLVEIQL